MHLIKLFLIFPNSRNTKINIIRNDCRLMNNVFHVKVSGINLKNKNKLSVTVKTSDSPLFSQD